MIIGPFNDLTTHLYIIMIVNIIVLDGSNAVSFYLQ